MENYLQHTSKYIFRLYDYYLGRDFDIVKVQVHPWMLLRPVHITPVLKRVSAHLEHIDLDLMVEIKEW